jgi:hypothetical protein
MKIAMTFFCVSFTYKKELDSERNILAHALHCKVQYMYTAGSDKLVARNTHKKSGRAVRLGRASICGKYLCRVGPMRIDDLATQGALIARVVDPGCCGNNGRQRDMLRLHVAGILFTRSTWKLALGQPLTGREVHFLIHGTLLLNSMTSLHHISKAESNVGHTIAATRQ